jgi:hypothetical protein
MLQPAVCDLGRNNNNQGMDYPELTLQPFAPQNKVHLQMPRPQDQNQADFPRHSTLGTAI